MATIANITNNVLDSILPVFGNPRTNLPVWNESQKMFITSEYESQAGNRYYKGIRFSNRLVIIEKVGLYHTWTYIDEVELYAFDGKQPVLIGNKKFEKEFYDVDIIRNSCKQMLKHYLMGQMKMMKTSCKDEQLENMAEQWIADSYRSFLHDNNQLALENMMPLLESNK